MQRCMCHATQAVTAAPEIAKQYSQQIVETEHLLKALLEQPNGLARKIISKADGNPTALLDATEAFIRRQPRVSGDSSQVSFVGEFSFGESSCAARIATKLEGQCHCLNMYGPVILMNQFGALQI